MSDKRGKRKLTAIMSADVVGYSRLMEDNEEATIQTLNAYSNSMSTLIVQHRGRVVDMTGDNLMAEFSSVVDAIKCAVETQKEMSKRNADLPENRRMLFRIGVNLGDIVEEDDRIYGDGVNIAARLQEIASPGALVISDIVHRSIDGKQAEVFSSLGPQSLKGLKAPITSWRVVAERPAESRFEAQHPRRLTPLVGRDAELRFLLDGWERARSGEGQTVLLGAEAGLGKSRLGEEFRRQLEGETGISGGHP